MFKNNAAWGHSKKTTAWLKRSERSRVRSRGWAGVRWKEKRWPGKSKRKCGLDITARRHLQRPRAKSHFAHHQVQVQLSRLSRTNQHMSRDRPGFNCFYSTCSLSTTRETSTWLSTARESSERPFPPPAPRAAPSSHHYKNKRKYTWLESDRPPMIH